MTQIPDNTPNEPNSTLAAWKKLNKQLITKGETVKTDNVLETEHRSETLEKLTLGLQLLREFKTTQDETQGAGIFIEPLQAESSIEDCLQAIKNLANQAAFDDYYAELQDACLLIEDALCELSANEFASAKIELLPALNDWALSTLPEPELIPTFTNFDLDTVFDDNEPVLLLPADQYSETLEKLTLGLQLLREFKTAQGESSCIFIEALQTESSIDVCIQAIQALANQAALNADCAELQDACLLIEDALCELSPNEFASVKTELLAALNDWALLTLPESEPIPTFTDFDLDTAFDDNKPVVLTQDSPSSPFVEPQNESVEKLSIGLQLLREFKTAQGETDSRIFIEPLQTESSVEACIQAIQTLANQAALNEAYAELQDACFLIEDALCELSVDEFTSAKTELLAALNAWALLPLPEPERVDNIEADNVPTSLQEPVSYTDTIASIEKLAELADEEGYSGLASVSLLIVEALHELSQNTSVTANTDLLSLLDNWSTLTEAYRQHSPVAIDGIISIMRHPDLNIPLDEEDFATFSTLLAEEISTTTAVEQDVDTHAVSDEPTVLPTTVAAENEEVVEPLSAMAQELVELLETEAGLLNYRFLAISFDELIAAREEHLQLAGEELSRLANASTMIGFAGLSEVCNHINANISHYSNNIDSFTVDKRDLLIDWVSQVKAYLKAFSKTGAGKQLLAQMSDSQWVQPLTPEASSALLPKMQVKGLNDESAEEETRETIASDDNVSLALPDDVNKELLDLLLQELPSYTQQFSEAIQRMQSGGGSSKDIDVAQRVAHTIKGSANTVGIKGIAFLTHQIEDILMACAKAHKQPGPALMSTLINASDCLEAMCESLLGLGDPPQDAQQVLQEVLDWANQIAKNGIQETDTQPPATPVRAATVETVKSSAPAQTAKPAPKKEETTESAQVAMVRVPTDQIENLFKLSSESIILNGQIYERQRRLKNQLQAMEAQFALLQQLGAELEQLIDLKDLSGRSLTHTGKDFDALEMDQYNELHTASRRMVEASVDAREISVDMKKELEYMNEILEYQQRLVINTQEAVMQTRFIPVGSIGLRLQRGVRQTCRLTGKQAELTLSGEELLIDGDTLGALVEPLMHLLRNAIDHGLESEDERIAVGKPPIGACAIEFDREGNSILVRCRDDGRGLDFPSIRQTAEKRGDLRAGETFTEDELKNLILRPNFSTRSQSTQTSGRGVGMDVVNFQVLSLGGSLSLNSVWGQGLTVELRVPLPLSRSHALLANAGSYKVAISSKGLTQILYSGMGDIKTISNEQVLIVGEDIYPVVKLEDLLHVHDRRKGERPPHGAVLLVQNENKITAVLVDSITDSRDVVIKSLGYYMRKIHGFVGATILGDGSVTPVLDIPELLRTPVHVSRDTSSYVATEAEPSARFTRILVVDDSLSQRRALEQILMDAGFKVHTARDGIEAVEWLSHSKPDVVVTDLEMPRMNGLELASHIRTQANTKKLPIIMITSRSTEKHRQLAEEAGIDFYLVKPVQDDNLLTKIQTLIDKQRDVVGV